jgi:hypothetical protein
MRPFFAPKKYHVFNNTDRKPVDLNATISYKSIDSIELTRS